MTSRLVLVVLLAVVVTNMFPHAASAQTNQTKTRLVFDIKNFQTITIPTLDELTAKPEPEVEAVPIVIEPPKPKNYVPPKVAPEDRVYMHEPELREYLCPKMGLRDCEIFIAILKAENGTHECTRDNRGLNRNGSIDIGLAQINWRPGNIWHTYEQLQDCKYNLDVALEMYSRRGFQPWYAYTKGAYLKFLKPVPQVAAVTIQ